MDNIGIFTEAFLESNNGIFRFTVKCEKPDAAMQFISILKQAVSQL